MIDKYRNKVYSNPPCWELVSDVYINEIGFKVKPYKSTSSDTRDVAAAFRLALHNKEHGFVKIDSPRDFCVVLMGSKYNLGLHHCGVYYKGKVLHALLSGNVYQDMYSLKDTYKLMEYWIPKTTE